MIKYGIKKNSPICCIALIVCLLVASVFAGAFYGRVFADNDNTIDAENAAVAVLPDAAAVYRIGAQSNVTDSADETQEYAYADLADGYNAAVLKAKEIKGRANPVVKVVLEKDWHAEKETMYDALTQFGSGSGFASGMLHVPYGCTMIIDLNGHVLDRALAQGYIDTDDSLVMYPETVSGGVIKTEGCLLVTDTSSTASGKITGGKAVYGGGVKVESGAELYLYSGAIDDNAATFGGGVFVDVYGVFRMFGGVIENNYARNGGGIGLETALLELLGGEVKENTARSNGGGVYYNAPASEIATSPNLYALYDASGKTLAQRNEQSGDTWDEYYGELPMTARLLGGSVMQNSADHGGGVYYTKGDLTVKNATVAQNSAGYTCGGIYGESTLFVGGATVIEKNSAGRQYKNLSLANGAELYADTRESFRQGAKIEISNPENIVNNYDAYTNNSTDDKHNLDENGIPVNPARFISYTDCCSFDGEYRTVRKDIGASSIVYASKYYVKWDLYYVANNTDLGDKITTYKGDDQAELANGYSVTFSFGDYVNTDIASGQLRYAVAFKASVYTKTESGEVLEASDLDVTLSARGYANAFTYIDTLGRRWQAETTTEYNGEKFYLLVNYKQKSIDDSDMTVTLQPVSDPVPLQYDGNMKPQQVESYSLYTVVIQNASNEILQQGTDFSIRAKESESNEFRPHASDKLPIIIEGRGNYTGVLRFEEQITFTQSDKTYYFDSWGLDGEKYTSSSDKPIIEYNGQNVFDGVRLYLTVSDVEQVVTSKSLDGYYSTADRAIDIKLYADNNGTWESVTKAVNPGTYKAQIYSDDYSHANSDCRYLTDPAQTPEDKPGYFDFEFEIAAKLIDFNTVFSQNNSLDVNSENPRFYTVQENNVRNRLADFVSFYYYDDMITKDVTAESLPVGAAYVGADGKVKYVQESEAGRYVYYREKAFNVSLDSSLIIDPILLSEFMSEYPQWDGYACRWNDWTLNFFGTSIDFSAYSAYGKDAFYVVGSSLDYYLDYSYGNIKGRNLLVDEIADVSAVHKATYADGTEQTFGEEGIVGQSGAMINVETTVTITFHGYADAQSHANKIVFVKNWAIVSACNGVVGENGQSYVYADGDIEYGGGNQNAPRAQYGDTLIVGLTAHNGKSAKCVITHESTPLLYAYDESAEDKKGQPLDDTFAQYVMGFVAQNGVGTYTLTAQPTAYYNPRDGLIYAGAETEFTFTVVPVNTAADDDTLHADVASAVYNGSEIEPSITVTVNGLTVPESDYTLTYENNVSAGTGKVTVTPVSGGLLGGEKTFEFTIAKAEDNVVNNVYIADWYYAMFDRTANRVFGSAKYGYETARFAVKEITNADASTPVYADIGGLESFTTDVNGRVEQAVADKLNALHGGSYVLIVSVPSTGNYNGAQKEYRFGVLATEYAAPTLSYISQGAGKNDVYTGYELSVSILGYDTVGMQIVSIDERLSRNGNTLYATNAGEYAISFALTDTENSTWADGSDEPVRTVVWKIDKKTVEVPKAGSGSFLISGKPITYIPDGFDESVMHIDGNVQSDAGDFDVLITLKDPDNYKWAQSESGASYGDVIVRSFTVIGAMKIFIIVMCILGGIALVAALIALGQYISHKRRLQMLALVNESKAKEDAE